MSWQPLYRFTSVMATLTFVLQTVPENEEKLYSGDVVTSVSSWELIILTTRVAGFRINKIKIENIMIKYLRMMYGAKIDCRTAD